MYQAVLPPDYTVLLFALFLIYPKYRHIGQYTSRSDHFSTFFAQTKVPIRTLQVTALMASKYRLVAIEPLSRPPRALSPTKNSPFFLPFKPPPSVKFYPISLTNSEHLFLFNQWSAYKSAHFSKEISSFSCRFEPISLLL